MNNLPTQSTLGNRSLTWRNHPIYAHEPVATWEALLASRALHEEHPFFKPFLSELPDPFLMVDMQKAVDRICQALDAGERIHIFGDFDADGVCGTTILFEAFRAIDAKISYSIPHRSEQGHGIGEDAVEEALQAGCKVGISVDTGITCFAAAELAMAKGLDIIITDHHLPDRTLPSAYAILNPAREDCGFADRQLCGTGVAFYLLVGIWKVRKQQGRPYHYDLRQLLDRVAIATVADVMSLVGINRILVHQGLQRMNQNLASIGVTALIKAVASRQKVIDAQTIGFFIAPHINAAGRMLHGEEALKLLSCQDPAQTAPFIEVLLQANKTRRTIESEVFQAAEARLNGGDLLAAYDDQWHAGVVGLAAGRLARKYHRPAAIGFLEPDGLIRLSLRSVSGYHIGEILHACSDCLVGFGGHQGAGGASLQPAHWQPFLTLFAQAIADQSGQQQLLPTLAIDGSLQLSAIHIELVKRLQRFEPFGRGNAPVVWLVQDVTLAQLDMKAGGVMRMRLSDGVQSLNAVMFGATKFKPSLSQGAMVSVIGSLQEDSYRGHGAIQFVVEDFIV
ncbi:MAG: single-stranded-DNA-specific exonuclease RecJ [Zetaproteobacteria bacterium]|nr:single-stranded-DNA-specific exonuclease RecJ [Zetaproteobacteria bacterium]